LKYAYIMITKPINYQFYVKLFENYTQIFYFIIDVYVLLAFQFRKIILIL